MNFFHFFCSNCSLFVVSLFSLLGRHPVVESRLSKQSSTSFSVQSNYVPNSCSLNASTSIWLITGANMAGKSCFLRSIALLILLSQIGSYVPASSCRLTVVDQLFSRVGSSDNLYLDQSTFYLEMSEISNILHRATSRSFVIIDEAGRGTSSTDGLSLAVAMLEHIHNKIQCRTLFATHYHELSLTQQYLKKLQCYMMEVKTVEENSAADSSLSSSAIPSLIFPHRLIPGVVSSSYGIPIALYAGVPASVIERAQEVLEGLQSTPILDAYKQIVKQSNKDK